MAQPPKEINVDVNFNFSPMAQMATELHELFMSYVQAGFTREEALTLVLSMIRNHPGGQS